MSEHWPPEWEDPEEEFPGEADQLDATVLASGGEARLSEVAAFLASVPAPALPDAVEARISAALAAEAATRTDHATPAAASAASASASPAPAVGPASAAPAVGPASAASPDGPASAASPDGPASAASPDGPASAASPDGRASTGPASADGSRKLGPSRVRPRVRRHSGSGRPRREFRVRPQLAAGSLIVCLVLAGLGYAISLGSGPQSSYSSSAGAPAAGSGAEGASSAAASSAAGPALVPSAGAVPRPETTAGPEAAFAVIMSGTKYTQATLAEQVRTRLGANGGQETFGQSAAGAGASPASGAGPSQALQGCVLHLTNGAVPRLVDRAVYQGEPVYVIASSTHVWVVGLGCTAAKTELIESVPLAGLSGNLRALISVEQQAFTGRRVQ
jgi:hypothetical protein